jgi:hypothetical protein
MNIQTICVVSALALVAGCFPTKQEEEVVGPQFLTPAANEVLLIDGEYSLSWSAPGFGVTLLQLSSDSARSWEVLDTLSVQEVASGGLSWVVPNVVPTSKGCVLRLVGTARGDTITSPTFTITGLQILSPRSGDTLKAGQIVNVVWKTYKYNDVLVWLLSDRGFPVGIKSVGAASRSDSTWQSFSWTVPDTTNALFSLRFSRYNGPDEYFKTGLFSIE